MAVFAPTIFDKSRMNYRHAFHAGNFADILKHAVHALLLDAMQRKDKGFLVLDTHAGRGLYDLAGEAARRTGEAEGGVHRLLSAVSQTPEAVPEALEGLLAAIRAENPEGGARYYPGSPRIAAHVLREQDRLVVCEPLPEEASVLRGHLLALGRRVQWQEDGWAALKAVLPPLERRGLILIDPPYERADEFDVLIEALREAFRRFPTGVYAIWYPIKDRPPLARFHRRLAAMTPGTLLRVELCLHPDRTATRLNGSGLVIVNPPWPLAERLAELVPWLWRVLGADPEAPWHVDWLVDEQALRDGTLRAAAPRKGRGG